jgi:hypothetical protein
MNALENRQMPETDLFGEEISHEAEIREWKKKQLKANPLLRVFGTTPGEKCMDCIHLYAHRCSKTYYKCDLRPFTFGPGTDHRVRWPACGKFERLIDFQI